MFVVRKYLDPVLKNIINSIICIIKHVKYLKGSISCYDSSIRDDRTVFLTEEQVIQAYTNHVPNDKEEHVYMFAIIRNDIIMPPGKMSAQAGHAYTDALTDAFTVAPEMVARYRDPTKGGSKVTLKSKNLNQLLKAFNQARSEGLPCSIVVDQHHVLPPHFDGNPIITAVGIGPCTKSQCEHITKKFNCV